MGHKTLKRVPLDFDWPLKKLWKGYVNPYYRKCPDCENGQTTAGDAFKKIVHLLMIAGGGSFQGVVHPWLSEIGIATVSSDMVALTSALAGRFPGGAGHDECDLWSAYRKIVSAAGLPKDWGECKTCHGEVLDPAVKKDYDAWEEFEPPAGDGFQLWETCSEGSPVSPVFATAEELATWCENHSFTVGDFRATKKEWLKMFETPDGCDAGTMLISFTTSPRRKT